MDCEYLAYAWTCRCQMSDRDMLGSLRFLLARGNLMNGMQCVGTVITISTYVADTHDDIF